MYKLVFTRGAVAEYNESASWYDNQKAGLGDLFEKSIEDTLSKIAVQPKANKVLRSPYREASVTKFPFVIIYK